MSEGGAAQTGNPIEHRRDGRLDDGSSKSSLWKSVIGATGGAYGCERETLYREVMRDARGYRMQFGMPERVIFGTAVDAAHALLVDNRPIDVTVIGIDLSDEGTGEAVTEDEVRDLADRATSRGVERARGERRDAPWTDEDWRIFRERVGLAVEKALGLWPNIVNAKGEAQPEPDEPGPPILWTDPAPGLVIEGQRRLYAPDVVGGRGIVGKPDYVYSRDGVIVGWLDVKALAKSGSYPAKWAAGEALAYDYMVTVENEGALPEWHAYLEYRRLQKPYWALTVAEVHPSALPLAQAYFRRWERALDAGDPDAVSFNLASCATCPWREAIPEVRHDGCPIGPAALDIVPSAG